MKYKIAICDDSETDRKIVSDMVNVWAVSVGRAVCIDAFSSAEAIRRVQQRCRYSAGHS